MNHRAQWAVWALVAFLAGCCQDARSVDSRATENYANKPTRVPRELPPQPDDSKPNPKAESETPLPGNAFSSFIDNKSNSWTISRIEFPTTANAPETPPAPAP